MHLLIHLQATKDQSYDNIYTTISSKDSFMDYCETQGLGCSKATSSSVFRICTELIHFSLNIFASFLIV